MGGAHAQPGDDRQPGRSPEVCGLRRIGAGLNHKTRAPIPITPAATASASSDGRNTSNDVDRQIHCGQGGVPLLAEQFTATRVDPQNAVAAPGKKHPSGNILIRRG
jgi:hypothetical protein